MVKGYSEPAILTKASQVEELSYRYFVHSKSASNIEFLPQTTEKLEKTFIFIAFDC